MQGIHPAGLGADLVILGGMPLFAAVCTDDRSADKLPLRFKRRSMALSKIFRKLCAVGSRRLAYETQLSRNGGAIVIVTSLDHHSVLNLHNRAIADFGSFSGRREIP